MFELILGFLAASLVLYAILGGADFGAGIVEIVCPQQLRAKLEGLTYRAMGPVWEANHMWLILAVVILFNGFPKIYSELSTVLHLPITFLLMGVIGRGCAFTFRHYDAKVDHTRRWYSLAFRSSSVISALFIGLIVGAMIAGDFINSRELSYFETYWQPWAGIFPLTVGLFVLSLFAYTAAVFLLGETTDAELLDFLKTWSKRFLLASVISGAAVFAVGALQGVQLLAYFLRNPVAIVLVGTATILLAIIWWQIESHRSSVIMRLCLGLQLTAITLGWIIAQFPDLIRYRDGSSLSILTARAPDATLYYLAAALGIGSLLIFPALAYLMIVFKSSQPNT